jgi:hypothetical protein
MTKGTARSGESRSGSGEIGANGDWKLRRDGVVHCASEPWGSESPVHADSRGAGNEKNPSRDGFFVWIM